MRMSYLCWSILFFYWLFGTIYMTKGMGLSHDDGGPTLLDLFFAATVFWMVGPIAAFFYWLDRVKL
jgi:hypothetical protein